jgi:hypothetical protein
MNPEKKDSIQISDDLKDCGWIYREPDPSNSTKFKLAMEICKNTKVIEICNNVKEE